MIITGATDVQTGAIALKDVENRSWKTSYRGPVLIHASEGPDDITPADIERRFAVRLTGEQPRSGVIGMVEIVDCVQPHPSRWYAPNHFAFVLRNPHPLTFVKWRGALSLRTAPPELLELCGLLIP
ncbi:hypothetical protein [Bradyrhizobium huanghuaihaiense]|uniref:hypothetical protein n=1 Tax=Bradyrhizobium huanghuaihaiense TaxID=990078 RepID=UPI001FCE572D|nr:hypothetical protein [Bradyrhizobium huanghuaihaiense]